MSTEAGIRAAIDTGEPEATSHHGQVEAVIATGQPDGSASVERVLVRVRLRACRRAAWLRMLWSREAKPSGEIAVTHAEMDTHLEDRDAPDAEAEWYEAEPSVADLNRRIAKVERAIARDNESRLARLVRVFRLDEREEDLFQACLAVAVDPALSRVYAYLNDHVGRGYVTEELAARLFGHGRGGVWCAESALRRWALVAEEQAPPGEPAALVCDRFVRDWVLNRVTVDPRLAGLADLVPLREPLESWPVEEAARESRRLLGGDPPVKLRIHVVGPPGSGRRTLAAAVGERLGRGVLAVDTERCDDASLEKAVRAARRQAHLDGLALAWTGDPIHSVPSPRPVPPVDLEFLIAEAGGEAPSAGGKVVEHRIEMPSLGLDERRALWQRLVPHYRSWPEDRRDAILCRRTQVGEIARAARRRVCSPEEAAAAIREGQRDQLGGLAKRLECPFTWDDLVVPERIREVLQELAFEARDRDALWENPAVRRLFPQGRGLLALFSGPPGTGKTMAAQVIAADLEADLYRIDLSTVVSKYVGETSKNLERILSRARHMDAVLLFDEADALFGKRTEVHDAHDRFANVDISYLLQAIEDYSGVALLSTNKKGNVDDAFTRRLRFVVEFSMPSAGGRLDLWRRLVGELTGCESQGNDAAEVSPKGSLEGVASGSELTGAEIKYAVLTALLAARKEGRSVELRHLLHGVERELMKKGRALSDRDRRRWTAHTDTKGLK